MKWFLFKKVGIKTSQPKRIIQFTKYLILIFISCYSLADDDILYSDKNNVQLEFNDGESNTIECRVKYSYKPGVCGTVRCFGGVATQTCPGVKSPKSETKCSCIDRKTQG